MNAARVNSQVARTSSRSVIGRANLDTPLSDRDRVKKVNPSTRSAPPGVLEMCHFEGAA
jgi:hypothetical protein